MSSSVTSIHFTSFFILFMITTTYGDFCEDETEAIAIVKRVEKATHLHFYFHDMVSGKNATVVKIAGPPNSTASGFGSTMMTDDLLTEGPELTSKPVGKAQGIYAMAAQHDVSLLMVMSYSFTEGKFNGSSISILGRNHVLDDLRELAIVGGSGIFRLARGYALAHTVWFDPETGDATVEYNVYVNHY